jgi:hypothetical protein
MFNRTITISSAGKMFSATGWKIGWAIGPKHLIEPIWLAHQWVCFSVATPLQVRNTHFKNIQMQPPTPPHLIIPIIPIIPIILIKSHCEIAY